MENKYKEFRNFMFNELGITRKDVEQWTREAVNERVDAKIKHIISTEVINIAVDKAIATNARSIFSGYQTQGLIVSALAEVIKTKLKIEILP